VHVVIMGCGRVGSALAKSLEAGGHTVAIIDRDAIAFRRLSIEFVGQRVTGIGFDRDTLVEAGIDRAEAFAAVSSGDNSNIIAARVARETFGIEKVATVRWTADQVIRRLLPAGMLSQWRDPSGHVVLAELAYNPTWIGHKISQLEEESGARVALLTRYGDGILPKRGAVIQDGDLVHVTMVWEEREQIERVFAAGPTEGH
jgi:trk system potassium uptake protein TrkA